MLHPSTSKKKKDRQKYGTTTSSSKSTSPNLGQPNPSSINSFNTTMKPSEIPQKYQSYQNSSNGIHDKALPAVRRRMRRPTRNTKTPFNLKLWLKSRYEIVTTSMFFSPMLAVFAAIALGFGLSALDAYFAQKSSDSAEPALFKSNLLAMGKDSARAMLGTIAGATITFAGTAFSVSLLVIQLGSSQYSPRIVTTLLQDPSNRRVVALVLGTFTYSLVVMRSIDDNSEATGPVVPKVSVAVAFVLGIISLLAIVAFIDHSANTMDISQLMERVARDTILHIQQYWEEDDGEEDENRDDNDDDKNKNKNKNDGDGAEDANQESTRSTNSEKSTNSNGNSRDSISSTTSTDENKDKSNSNYNDSADYSCPTKCHKGEEREMEQDDDFHVVRFRQSGWVQEMDVKMLLKMVPPNGYIKVHTLAGRYAIPGSAVCSVYPKPTCSSADDDDDNDDGKDDPGDTIGKAAKEHVDDVEKQQDSERQQKEEEKQEKKLEDFDDHVLDCIMIGYGRTMRSDASYGLRQLVDVILRALSPGVNDPTTAQDGIFHVAAVVTEFLTRRPPAKVLHTEENGKLVLNEQLDHDQMVRLGFDEVRVYAASSPTVGLYLLEALRLIRESLNARGFHNRAPELERQARLIEQNILKIQTHVEDDRRMIQEARADRFPTNVARPPGMNGMQGWLLSQHQFGLDGQSQQQQSSHQMGGEHQALLHNKD